MSDANWKHGRTLRTNFAAHIRNPVHLSGEHRIFMSNN